MMSRTSPRLSLVAVALVVACGPGDLNTVNADIDVSPLELDFGDGPVLDIRPLTATVANLGTVDLNVSSIRIEGDPAFQLPPESIVPVIFAVSEHPLVVHLVAPEMRSYEGTLVIESDDLDEPVVRIPLKGSGTTVAKATITPATLDFGRVGEGRTALRRVSITSSGTADLKITTIDFEPGTSSAYGFVGSTATPAVVRKHEEGREDETVEITVKFAPTVGLTETGGTLLLATTDPDNAIVRIPLTASLNRQPIADAGANKTVVPGATVPLDGTASSDPDNDVPLTFLWKLVAKPPASAAAFNDDTSATPTFRVDQPGSYVAELVVTDAAGLASKPKRVTIDGATGDGLTIELVWNHPVADLDLHVLEEGALLNGPTDCFGAQPAPDWGVIGDPDDDPFHQGDVLSGYGPEVVRYAEPPDGRYEIHVVYVSPQTSTDYAVPATLRVKRFGVTKREFTKTLTTPGEMWNIAIVDWPTGDVTPSGSVAP